MTLRPLLGLSGWADKSAAHCTFPLTVYKCSNFFISLPTLVIYFFLNNSHPNGVRYYLIVVLGCVLI